MNVLRPEMESGLGREQETDQGSVLTCDARSVGGKEEMFAPVMRATPMLALSSAAASGSESKSVVGLGVVSRVEEWVRLGG